MKKLPNNRLTAAIIGAAGMILLSTGVLNAAEVEKPKESSMKDKMVYQLETVLPFGEVVAKIEQQSVEHKFRVLHTHDVQATLAEKGFQRKPLKIIEVCNSGFANEALNKDLNVALFMPCRFVVAEADGKTLVALSRPTMIADMMPESGLDTLAQEVEKTLIDVMNKAIGK